MTPILNARGRWIDPETGRYVPPPLTVEQRQHAAMVELFAAADEVERDPERSTLLPWLAVACAIGVVIGIAIVRVWG